jgi:uncharacterized protein YciI
MLSFEWNAPPRIPAIRNGPRTFVVVQFASAGERRTHVKLTHAGWGLGPDWDEAIQYFEKAWTVVLERLAKRFVDGPHIWPPAPAAAAQSPNATAAVAKPAETIAARPRHFLALLRPTRPEMFANPSAADAKLLREHAQYLRKLQAECRTQLLGRCMDIPTGGFGLVVFAAADEAGARETLAADPAVRAGVLTTEVHPFEVVDLRAE